MLYDCYKRVNFHSLTCRAYELHLLGTFFVEPATSIYITSERFTASLHREYCTFTLWTFTTHNESRIVLEFLKFDLENSTEFLEIGDGPDHRRDTIMTIFSGHGLPSNVTSVSSSAWIKFRYHLNKCCRNPSLEFAVSAVNKSGILKQNQYSKLELSLRYHVTYNIVSKR